MSRMFDGLRNFADRIASYAVFLSIVLATSYMVFPDLRRFVELNVTNRGAWYYIGVYKPEERRWGYYATEPDEPRRKIKNFYSAHWKQRDGNLEISHIRAAAGSILVPEVDDPVVGRKAESRWGGDDSKSNNPIVAIADKGDCLYAHSIEEVDTQKVKGHTIYLWMWAKKITCD